MFEQRLGLGGVQPLIYHSSITRYSGSNRTNERTEKNIQTENTFAEKGKYINMEMMGRKMFKEIIIKWIQLHIKQIFIFIFPSAQ